MKKHGGELLYTRLKAPVDGGEWDHHIWQADGSPFAREQYRPAKPPSVSTQPRIRPPVVGEQSDLSAEQKTAAPLPDDLLKQLEGSLIARDPGAFLRAMEKLEEHDPKDQGDHERWRHFTEGLQGILKNPALMADGGSEFVLSVVQSRLRSPSKFSTSRRPPPSPYSLRYLQSGHEGATTADMFNRHVFADASCTVLHIPSFLDDWESTAAFTYHPGVLFGTHCSAELAQNSAEYVFGSGFLYNMPDEMRNWTKRYENEAVKQLKKQ